MNAFAWFFLSLRGRVSRQEFWLGYLGIIVVALILVHSLPYPGGAIYFLPGDTPDSEAWRGRLVRLAGIHLAGADMAGHCDLCEAAARP